VTDLIGVHRLWFHKESAYTYVPTGHVYKQALNQGLAKERVRLTGLPVHPAFAREKRDMVPIRRELGWDTELTTALIVGSTRSRQVGPVIRPVRTAFTDRCHRRRRCGNGKRIEDH
jgi:hypothetical protein